MKVLVAVLVAAACLAQAETIDVPAGQTRKVEPGRRFTGDVLVKTGAGELDLTGADGRGRAGPHGRVACERRA